MDSNTQHACEGAGGEERKIPQICTIQDNCTKWQQFFNYLRVSEIFLIAASNASMNAVEFP